MRFMKKIFFTILLILFSVISFFGQTVTSEEYKIYAIVLRKIYHEDLKGGFKNSFVILDKTKIAETYAESETTSIPENDNFVKELNESKEWKETWRKIQLSKTDDAFEAKNKISVNLQRLFPIKYQYWLANQDEIKKLLDLGGKDFNKIQEERRLNKKPIFGEPDDDVIWKYFNEKYSNAYSYYQFSRVGFSSNKRFARVDVDGRGAEWSSNTTYILKKTKGNWKIYTSFAFESIS